MTKQKVTLQLAIAFCQSKAVPTFEIVYIQHFIPTVFLSQKSDWFSTACNAINYSANQHITFRIKYYDAILWRRKDFIDQS